MAAALETYDSKLWGVDVTDIEVQVNAIGLLIRLYVRDVAPAELLPRWVAVLEACSGSPYLHAYPLHNLLRLSALQITGLAEEASALLRGMRSAAADAAAAGRPQLLEEVVPLAEAIVQVLDASAEPSSLKRTKMSILQLRGKSSWAAVGGSEEQRGFLLELAVGPVRAGQPTTRLGQAMLELV